VLYSGLTVGMLNRVLRIIFEPKTGEASTLATEGGWNTRLGKKIHNELGGFYWLDFIWVLKSRRMRETVCVSYGGEEKYVQGFGGET